MTDIIVPTAPMGTDGHVPIYEPNARWTQWALKDVYMGTDGYNKYVAKVDDYVIDTELGVTYRVVSLDESTLVPTLGDVEDIGGGGDIHPDDLLMGTEGRQTADTYRIYVDKSVLPNRLCVDSRFQDGGTGVSYAQIFRGSRLDGTAKVVSAVYDQSGKILGQNIPLELVGSSKINNHSIWCVPPCSASQDIKAGEMLTLVFYTADGGVSSIRQLLAEETTFIRQTDTSQKYITGIYLDTPFLSASDKKLIQYPLNVPTNGLNLFGIVQYSDGTSLRMPVDGTRFQLLGLSRFVATIMGQRVPVVLVYNLSPGETMYGIQSESPNYITEKYELKTVKADGTYSSKLFGYPKWMDAVSGYRLEWWLMNLDRKEYYPVTTHVRINENTAPFDPIYYGATQRLSVSINLRDVNPIFKNFVHTQTVDITLLRPGMDHTGTNWTIGFDPGQNPPYGRENAVSMEFVNQNLKRLNLTMGETDPDVWLNRLYWQTKPLYNPATEIDAPDPDMFRIIIPGGQSYEFTMEQWDNVIEVSDRLSDSSTIFILFFKRTPDTDIVLSIAGVPVYELP